MAANPVLNGILAAMQLRQAMEHASLQREELARRKHRDEREDKLTDFRTQMGLLDSGAKPVDGAGNYQGSVQMPTFNPMDPTRPNMVATPSTIPTDPGRTVQSPGGGQFYIPTQDERFSESFRRKAQEHDMEQAGKLRIMAAENDFRTGLQRSEIASREGIAKLNREADTIRQERSEKFHVGESEKDRKARKEQNDADNRTRLTAEGMQQAGADRRHADSEERLGRRQQQAMSESTRLSKIEGLKRERDDLEREEAKLHQDRYDIGASAGDPTAREGMLTAKQQRVDSIGKRKGEIANALKMLEGGGGDTTAPARPAKPASAKNPYR